MAPEWGVAAVETLENSGVTSAAPNPRPATRPTASLGVWRSQGRARTAREPSMPATMTTNRRVGNHCGVRSRSTKPQMDVVMSAAARHTRAVHLDRRCQSPTALMPLSAASGGASATV